jgi:hypothetical protein
MVLTEAQVVALERAKAEKEAQQTFIGTYTKVSFVKLYDRKTPITAADLLHDRVRPAGASIAALKAASELEGA